MDIGCRTKTYAFSGGKFCEHYPGFPMYVFFMFFTAMAVVIPSGTPMIDNRSGCSSNNGRS